MIDRETKLVLGCLFANIPLDGIGARLPWIKSQLFETQTCRIFRIGLVPKLCKHPQLRRLAPLVSVNTLDLLACRCAMSSITINRKITEVQDCVARTVAVLGLKRLLA